MYARFFKRLIDFFVSFFALIILLPIFLILIISGAIAMKGNPFFTQLRPGKIDKHTGQEKIFKLLKFRTMSNAKDKNGNFLPDDIRLNRYGKFLRSSSLDEIPELINILKGDMSLVGPRPLLVEYLPYYSDTERQRHRVRPGLTGLAQINGRNFIDWDTRLSLDLEYVKKITFFFDLKIILTTIKKVIGRDNVSENTGTTEGNFAEIRKKQLQSKSKNEVSK